MTRIGQSSNRGLLDSRYVDITGDTMTGVLTNTVGIILSKIYPSADSTTAIQINKADGTTNVLNVDTTNGRVGIGTTAPSVALQVSRSSGHTILDVSNSTSGAEAQVSLTNSGTADNSISRFIATVSSSATGGSDPFIDFSVSGGDRYVVGIDNSDSDKFGIWENSNPGTNARLIIDTNGNVGIGTTTPTYLLSLGGNSARTFWMERHTTANTAGNTLTVQAGGATVGATDKAGGNLLLYPGVSTGSAESGVSVYGCVAGASGTADRTQTLGIQLLGNKLGFFSVTPVVRPTALTTQLTSITHTAPGTPDYAIQNFTQTTPFGFVTADEANTVLSVIANLQTRVSELETKLQALGLVS